MDKGIIKAANEGNVYAMLSLAYIYQRGIDVEPDPELAIQWYMRSARNGCSRAKWELAKIYHLGEIVERDDKEYLYWLKEAGAAGIPEANLDLSIRYYFGRLLPEDRILALSLLIEVADQGNPMGEFYLGNAYLHGLGLKKDVNKAQQLFELVRTHGDADLYNKIGMMLEFGLDGVEVDLSRALGWYRIASEMGSDKGYYSMMVVKKAIHGEKQETQEARKKRLDLLLSSVEDKQRIQLLEEGDSMMDDGDFDSAIERYKEAAELGNADAMYMLALLYHDGEVVKRNDPLAYDYLGRAALSGSTDAQMHLGKCYELGKGRPKDQNLALKYYAMAVANGNLVGYYELSRFMEHPERYVRENHRIVR